MDALERLRRTGGVIKIERTVKRAGDKVLDSWAKPARLVKETESERRDQARRG